ncbi:MULTISPECIES: GntR family transcriptional regulator [unclassified Leifsonia]|uniref:GntR family transcriptional regulator n=1 Tax=unclassified Leifsonia TaxID=2663824 RepID=UPI0008A7AAB7|nr:MULTISPECIES: GntR family transcriptional regulator [unclassified Leifsonia]SEH66867.1 DNA-binding transcriptional regulator, GntR family [Leifsonia sp. CL154]SFL28585.1 DNA-binding transcriptional regulator, GntR family [Leifsonia sp. CL147]
MTVSPPPARDRASDVAYKRLRAEIIEWTLEPGTRISETETAARLGVSRTPLREALSRLTAEGLVTSVGRTSTVAPLSRDHIVELFELREALETQAARLAARRRDPARFEELRAALLSAVPHDSEAGTSRYYELADALDRALEEAAGSRHLAASLRDMRGQLARARRISRQDRRRLDQATQEHLVIVGAIIAGDELLASQATAVHLHNSLENMLAHVP